MAEEKKEQVKLQKKDLVKHWLLGYSSETCYNYERLQALGTTNAMVPIVRRLYKTKEEQAKALKKYTVFFNTEPSWIGTVIHGVAASMEEQAANGADIDAEDINAVRTGLMGPMAGIGDTVSQGIAYPILAGIACSLALAGFTITRNASIISNIISMEIIEQESKSNLYYRYLICSRNHCFLNRNLSRCFIR